MSEVIYNKKAAVRNTVVYSVALVLSVVGLLTRSSWFGYISMCLVVLLAIGGLTDNW
jgi:hypothetical protein